MADYEGRLRLKLDASSFRTEGPQAVRSLADIRRENAALGTSADSTSKLLGKLRSALLGLGVGAILAAATESAEKFRKSIAEVSTLLTDTSGIEGLANSAKDLAMQFGQLPYDETRAFYQAVSAGAADAAAAVSITTQANKLAVGGVTDTKTALDGLTSTLNAYGKNFSEAGRLSDSFFVAVKSGKTTIADLSSNIGNVAPLAAQAGTSINELLSATAALTLGGQSTSKAMTGLQAILAAVAKPSSEASSLAKQLGIDFSASGLQAKGFSEFIAEVATKTKGSTEAMATLFGGVEAIVPALALAGNAGKDFRRILGDMEHGAGAADIAFQKMAESIPQQLARLRSTGSVIGIELGEGILRGFSPALKDLNDPKAFEELRRGVAQIGEFIGQTIGKLADVVGPLVERFQDLKAAAFGVGIALAGWKLGMLLQGLTSLPVLLGLAATAMRAFAAAVAANPIGAIAVLLGTASAALMRYTDNVNAAHIAELRRISVAAAYSENLRDLRQKTEQLTAAERALQGERLKNLRIEVGKAQSDLARIDPHNVQAFQDARGRLGELNSILQQTQKELLLLGMGFAHAEEATTGATDRLKILTKEASDFHAQMLARLAVEAQEIQASRAVAAAQLVGNEAVRQATIQGDANKAVQEARNAALKAGTSLTREEESAIRSNIRTKSDLGLLEQENIATRTRGLAIQREAAQAEALLTDARLGNTEASQLLAVRYATEDELLAKYNGVLDATSQALIENAVAREAARLATQAQIRMVQAEIDASVQQRQALAALADARNENTEASRHLAVQLAVENAVRQNGAHLTILETAAMIAGIVARHEEVEVLQRQTGIERELNNIRNARARQRAEFADFRQQTEAAKEYGSEIAGILQQYGLLSDATQELELHERALAIQRKDGGDVAAIEALLRSEMSVTQELQRQQAEYSLMARAMEPLNEAWRQMGETIKGAIADALVGTSVNWRQLLADMLSQWARAMVEMVARYIAAQRTMRAVSATTNATSGSSAAGGGGMYQNLGGAFFSSSSFGSSLMGNPMTSGGYGSSGALAWGAIWVAAVAVIVNYVRNIGTPKGQALLSAVNGQLGSAGTGVMGGGFSSATQAVAEAMGRTVAERVNAMIRGLDVQIESITNLEIGRIGRGKGAVHYVDYTNSVGLVVRQKFKDFDAAIDFAAVQAIKQATLAGRGATENVLAAIRNSVATTQAGIQSDIDFAKWVDSLGLSETAASLDAGFKALRDALDRARQLGIDQQAIWNNFAQQASSLRNDILGVQESPEDRMRRRRDEYNAWVLLEEAKLRVEQANLTTKIAQLRIDLELTNQEGNLGIQRLRGRAALIDAEAGLDNIELQNREAMLIALGAAEAALEQVSRALANLPPLISDDELEHALRGARRGSGGGGAAATNPLDDYIRQHQLSGMSDMGRQLHDIQQRFRDATAGIGKTDEALRRASRAHDEAIKAAHGNAAAIAKANEAYRRSTEHIHHNEQALAAANRVRQEEIALLVKEARKGANDFINPQGELGSSLSGVTDQAAALIQGLRDLHKEGAIGTAELHHLAAAIREAAQARRQTLVTSAADSLLGDLYNLLGMDKEAAQLKYQMAVAELQVRRAELAAAIDMYHLVGINLGLIDQLIQKVVDGGPSLFEGGGAGSGGGSDDGNLSRQMIQDQADAAQKFKEAVDAWAASAKSLQDALNGMLTNPAISALSPDQQLAESKRQYDEMRARAAAGDVDARNQLGGVAQSYLEMLRNFTGGGEYFSQVANSIYDQFRTLIAQPLVYGNVIAPTFGGAPPAPIAPGAPVTPVPVATGGGSSVSTARLEQILEALGSEEGRWHNRAGQSLDRLEAKTGSQSDRLERLLGALERLLVAA